MALLNTALANDILPGATDATADSGGVDIAQVIDDLLPSLHAGSRADLVWWTEAQLIQWLDEAGKRLAAIAGVFIGRQAGLTVPGANTSALPNQHIATIHVTVAGNGIRPANTIELESRDPNYQTTPGTPDHWYQDLLGTGSLGLAPVPAAEVALATIYEGWPTPLDAQQTVIGGPAPLKGYLAMYVLQEAYGREGEMEMPDVAAHAKARLDLYHRLFQGYYGSGN